MGLEVVTLQPPLERRGSDQEARETGECFLVSDLEVCVLIDVSSALLCSLEGRECHCADGSIRFIILSPEDLDRFREFDSSRDFSSVSDLYTQERVRSESTEGKKEYHTFPERWSAKLMTDEIQQVSLIGRCIPVVLWLSYNSLLNIQSRFLDDGLYNSSEDGEE